MLNVDGILFLIPLWASCFIQALQASEWGRLTWTLLVLYSLSLSLSSDVGPGLRWSVKSLPHWIKIWRCLFGPSNLISKSSCSVLFYSCDMYVQMVS
jgi:hypothetical protein